MIDYPLNLDLDGRVAVVIGGGRIATRKIRSLIRCHAKVTVICEQASHQIQEWSEHNDVIWIRRNWRSGDTDHAFLTIVATNNESVNTEIARSAGPNQLICVAGKTALGNFSVPAVTRRGRLTVAVATGGASPLYAKKLRDQIACNLDEDLEDYLDFLYVFRQEIIKKGLSSELKEAYLKSILQPKYHDRNNQDELMKAMNQWTRNQASETQS
ncbi:siroheme synthase [Sporolactobacillus shoreicorticis]|uniref:precorrin-2 dehydrogenase n=1 Tax=Sporolactobacillus shoreicorticis TaxID=1923877 RepID=A0ABW5S0M7_9BACL|nr:NAD(P)-dependent oxidoreductase [Sporolactobacillus shoreicorticis]MCO7125185.1 siroheme synthase [Sporolactobacillus shoreicorticis]